MNSCTFVVHGEILCHSSAEKRPQSYLWVTLFLRLCDRGPTCFQCFEYVYTGGPIWRSDFLYCRGGHQDPFRRKILGLGSIPRKWSKQILPFIQGKLTKLERVFNFWTASVLSLNCENVVSIIYAAFNSFWTFEGSRINNRKNWSSREW